MEFGRRYALVVGAMLAVSGTALAGGPTLQPTWTNAFTASPSQNGWIISDGFESIAMPPCDPGHSNCDPNKPRVAWLFADTAVRGPGLSYMPNNSIAVQTGQSGEPPTRGANLQFWARAWYPGLPGAGTGGFLPENITSSIPPYTYDPSTTGVPIAGWTLTGQETDPSLDAPMTMQIWPASGVYVPGTPSGKLVIFYEPSVCFGPANTAQDYAKCRNTMDPPPEFVGERISITSNPGTLTSGWLSSNTDLGMVSRFVSGNVPYVRWGVAALFDDPWIYIYGRPSENDPATHDIDETGVVVLAVTTYADIGNFANWYFLVNGLTWQQGQPARVSDLFPVAHTSANVFSVSKVSYNGKTTYVMVDSILPTANTAIRTSPTPLLWPDYAVPYPDPAMNLPVLTRKDSSGNVVTGGPLLQVVSAPAIDPNFASLFAYGATAHPELRNSGSTGTVPNSRLLISYTTPATPALTFFSNPLDSMWPWCAKGTDANGDGIGDDVSACTYCGNGVLDPGEDCDPSAPAASRFAHRLDTNANGKLDCSDASPIFALFHYQNYSTSANTAVACTSACIVDPTPCLPNLKCTSDAQCGHGQFCECYPNGDNCQCSSTGWTAYTSRDTPNGAGDYERVADLASAGLGCAHPAGISCRRISDKKDWSQTGEVVSCDTSYGFKCVNASQPSGHSCSDYEINLYCAPTRWFNRDTPNGSGDYERLADLRATDDACDHPTGVECQRISDGKDSSQTGEVLRCDTTYGFSCVNSSQSNRKCGDYQVRFYCGN